MDNDVRTMQKDLAGLRQEELEKKQKELSAARPIEEKPVERQIPSWVKEAEAPTGAETPMPKVEPLPEAPKEPGLREQLEEQESAEIPAPPREEEIPSQAAIPPVPTPPKEEIVLPQPPSRHSLLLKIVGALLILTFLFFIGTFSYWLFFVREKPQKELTPPPQEEIITEKPFPEETIQPETEPEEPPLPASFLPAVQDKIVEISSTQELPARLSNLIKSETLTPGAFTRVLFNVSRPDEKEYLSFSQLLKALEVSIPESVLSKLGDEFTFFLRPQKEGNRFGFIVRIEEKSGLWLAMKSWESSMSKDWEQVFAIWGKEPSHPGFREVNWQGTIIRYRVYEPGLGLNYTILEDKKLLIFAISGDSIHGAVQALK